MMIVDRIESRGERDESFASARIRCGSRTHTVEFQWNGPPSPAPGDAFLAMTLQPAMRVGKRLVIESEVSEKLMAASRAIQATYRRWNSRLSRVLIEAERIHTGQYSDASVQRGTACLFAGGLDSLYSLRTAEAEIETLIYLPYFDNLRYHEALKSEMEQNFTAIAEKTNKQLLQVVSNVRAFSDLYVNWFFYHGALLGALGHLLSGSISRLLVPGGYAANAAPPDGSHPELDPLWSTEDVSIEYHGGEASRFDKTVALADDTLVREFLRVCWSDTEYNCCQCPKCLRTMVSLSVLGKLSEFKTLPKPLDLDKVSSFVPYSESARKFVNENLEAALSMGADPDLVKALKDSLGRRRNLHPRWLLWQLRLFLEERRRDYWRITSS